MMLEEKMAETIGPLEVNVYLATDRERKGADTFRLNRTVYRRDADLWDCEA